MAKPATKQVPWSVSLASARTAEAAEMVEHLFILERRDDGVRSALASGRVRVTEGSGHSFEIDYAENPARDGILRLRLGAHSLNAEHLRAIADLLDAEQARLTEERTRCARVASLS